MVSERTERPLALLRFVEREGKKVLQQQVRVEERGIYNGVRVALTEWRDVPFEIEPPKEPTTNG